MCGKTEKTCNTTCPFALLQTNCPSIVKKQNVGKQLVAKMLLTGTTQLQTPDRGLAQSFFATGWTNTQ